MFLMKLLGWVEEERLAYSSETQNQKLDFTPQEEYCFAFEEFNNYRQTLSDAQQEVDAKLKSLQKKLARLKKGIQPLAATTEALKEQFLASGKLKRRRSLFLKVRGHVTESVFLLELLKKYAKGQAVAIRLSKQMKKVSMKLKLAIKEYNNIGGIDKPDLPLHLSFEDVKSPDSSIWQSLETPATSGVPLAIKTQCINLRCMVDRAKEEQVLCVSEMLSCLDWYKQQHILLQEIISSFSGGERSRLVREGLFVESRLHSLYLQFTTYVGELILPTTFSDMVEINLDASNTSDEQIDMSLILDDINALDDDSEESDEEEGDEDTDSDSTDNNPE